MRYPACHVLSLLSVIPVREKETESATNKCHSVCRHEEGDGGGHVKRHEDRPEPTMDHAVETWYAYT